MPLAAPVVPPHFLDPAVRMVYLRHSEAKMQAMAVKSLSKLGFPVVSVVRQRLSTALAARQEGLVFSVLSADWKLLGSIPYVNLTKKETEKLLASLATAESVQAFDREVASKKPRKRNDAKAVKFYIGTILSPPKGMLWLFSRNPNGGMLLDRTVHNFVTSLDLCMSRVQTDREYLERCFLGGGTIEKLADIVFTDSDPHKGGKQVLFLDFSYRSGKKKQAKRIVYKPSDVEIDYRIAGKNTDALRALLTEKHGDKSFPEPHESFFELVDRIGLDRVNKQLAAKWGGGPEEQKQYLARLALPTYVILPRNPGSRLVVDKKSKRLPVDGSYGYLEYLAFQPKAPELGMTASGDAPPMVEAYVSRPSRWRRDAFAAPNELDWILDREELARPSFRLWGRVMAMACVLLQTDLHHQNQRMRGLKPHIIDLENCLVKSCPAPKNTLIPEALGKAAAAGARPFETEATTNQIYLRERAKGRTSARLLRFDGDAQALEIKEGVNEALRAMVAIREEIANWVQAVDLANVVVRHVCELTGNLLTGIGELRAQLLAAANRDRKPDVVLGEYMAGRRDAAVAEWEGSKSPYQKEDNPKYGLELAGYNGRDFESRDVPSYYRRAGSLDLLTWGGEIVVYKEQKGDKKSLRFDHYHTHKGLDLLKVSLEQKLAKDEPTIQKNVDSFIASVFERTPSHVMGR